MKFLQEGMDLHFLIQPVLNVREKSSKNSNLSTELSWARGENVHEHESDHYRPFWDNVGLLQAALLLERNRSLHQQPYQRPSNLRDAVRMRVNFYWFFRSSESNLLHDDTNIVHIRNMVSRISYQIIEEIEINSEHMTLKAQEVRLGILPKLSELCHIILEVNFGLNYQMRASNSMADIILCCLQMDDQNSSLLKSIRNFLVNQYAQQVNHPEIIDNLLNEL